MELVYFPLLARNVLTLLLARDAGLDVAQRAVDWPAYKGETMFGQLPQLEGEGVPGGKMGQSMAIARFLARKAKRDGATDAEFARSEMLLEKMTEIYDCMKAKNAPARGVPESEVEALRETLATHFEHVDGLLDANAATVGDISAIAAVVMAREFGVDAILAKAPKTKAYYEAKSALVDETCGSFAAWFKPQ